MESSSRWPISAVVIHNITAVAISDCVILQINVFKARNQRGIVKIRHVAIVLIKQKRCVVGWIVEVVVPTSWPRETDCVVLDRHIYHRRDQWCIRWKTCQARPILHRERNELRTKCRSVVLDSKIKTLIRVDVDMLALIVCECVIADNTSTRGRWCNTVQRRALISTKRTIGKITTLDYATCGILSSNTISAHDHGSVCFDVATGRNRAAIRAGRVKGAITHDRAFSVVGRGRRQITL